MDLELRHHLRLQWLKKEVLAADLQRIHVVRTRATFDAMLNQILFYLFS